VGGAKPLADTKCRFGGFYSAPGGLLMESLGGGRVSAFSVPPSGGADYCRFIHAIHRKARSKTGIYRVKIPGNTGGI
jgi:hypothetical protein